MANTGLFRFEIWKPTGVTTKSPYVIKAILGGFGEISWLYWRSEQHDADKGTVFGVVKYSRGGPKANRPHKTKNHKVKFWVQRGVPKHDNAMLIASQQPTVRSDAAVAYAKTRSDGAQAFQVASRDSSEANQSRNGPSVGLPDTRTSVDRSSDPASKVDPAAVVSAAVIPGAFHPAAVIPAALHPAAVDPVAHYSAAVVPAAVIPAALHPAAVDPVAHHPAAVVPAAVDPAAVVPAAANTAVGDPSAPMSPDTQQWNRLVALYKQNRNRPSAQTPPRPQAPSPPRINVQPLGYVRSRSRLPPYTPPSNPLGRARERDYEEDRIMWEQQDFLRRFPNPPEPAPEPYFPGLFDDVPYGPSLLEDSYYQGPTVPEKLEKKAQKRRVPANASGARRKKLVGAAGSVAEVPVNPSAPESRLLWKARLRKLPAVNYRENENSEQDDV